MKRPRYPLTRSGALVLVLALLLAALTFWATGRYLRSKLEPPSDRYVPTVPGNEPRSTHPDKEL